MENVRDVEMILIVHLLKYAMLEFVWINVQLFCVLLGIPATMDNVLICVA